MVVAKTSSKELLKKDKTVSAFYAISFVWLPWRKYKLEPMQNISFESWLRLYATLILFVTNERWGN